MKRLIINTIKNKMNYIDENIAKPPYSVLRIWRKFICIIQQNRFIPSAVRIPLLRMAGIKIGKRCFIGSGIEFDGMRPDLIEIGSSVCITSSCKILTHYLCPGKPYMKLGKVKIEDGAFIGIGTMIVRPVTICERSIIGAGSIVTTDIPAAQIWAGNPARYHREVE